MVLWEMRRASIGVRAVNGDKELGVGVRLRTIELWP